MWVSTPSIENESIALKTGEGGLLHLIYRRRMTQQGESRLPPAAITHSYGAV